MWWIYIFPFERDSIISEKVGLTTIWSETWELWGSMDVSISQGIPSEISLSCMLWIFSSKSVNWASGEPRLVFLTDESLSAISGLCFVKMFAHFFVTSSFVLKTPCSLENLEAISSQSLVFSSNVRDALRLLNNFDLLFWTISTKS